MEIAKDTKVVGQAPPATAPAVARTAEPAAPAAQAPAAQAPAAPAAESGQAPPSAAAAETQPATPPETQPAAPQAQGGSRTLLWAVLILGVIIVALVAFNRSRAKS